MIKYFCDCCEKQVFDDFLTNEKVIEPRATDFELE